MSLFDLQPLRMEQVRANLATSDGATIRKLSGGLKPVLRTLRHKPWWMLLGPGPEGQTCGDCAHLTRRSGKYFKCGRQSITSGPGTDIRKKDEACRLFEVKGSENGESRLEGNE